MSVLGSLHPVGLCKPSHSGSDRRLEHQGLRREDATSSVALDMDEP